MMNLGDPDWKLVVAYNWADYASHKGSYHDALWTDPSMQYRRIALEKLAGPQKEWRTWFTNVQPHKLLEFGEIAFETKGITGIRIFELNHQLINPDYPVFYIQICTQPTGRTDPPTPLQPEPEPESLHISPGRGGI